MENKIRFRNHPSLILENSLKAIGSLIAIFFFNVISEVGDGNFGLVDIAILALIFLGFIAIAVGCNAFLWAKTYIVIEENTLVMERNTINKEKNTIGLKNVSNVNLEQNLFEMLLGTCKVKLDTNSLSTADETDVKIVLKKADAEKFRALVLARAEGVSFDEALQYASGGVGDLGDIILHGLFSIRIASILLVVILLLAEIGIVGAILESGAEGDIGELISGALGALCYIAVAVGGIVKEFVKYLGFRIERKKDKVYLNYGLFKKVAYSVPVDKINGICLRQTPLARLSKRYMVELINVGMDDDENEMNSFFLPYAKLDKIKEQLHQLLPEFDGALDIQEEKQPAAIWVLSIPWWILVAAVVAVAYLIASTYIADPETKAAVTFGFICGSIALVVCWFVLKLASFLTKGLKVDDRFLKVTDGIFGKNILFVKYNKIQYIKANQCAIAKHFGIQMARITLLASLKNRIHELPYFKENELERLKSKLI